MIVKTKFFNGQPWFESNDIIVALNISIFFISMNLFSAETDFQIIFRWT